MDRFFSTLGKIREGVGIILLPVVILVITTALPWLPIVGIQLVEVIRDVGTFQYLVTVLLALSLGVLIRLISISLLTSKSTKEVSRISAAERSLVVVQILPALSLTIRNPDLMQIVCYIIPIALIWLVAIWKSWNIPENGREPFRFEFLRPHGKKVLDQLLPSEVSKFTQLILLLMVPVTAVTFFGFLWMPIFAGGVFSTLPIFYLAACVYLSVLGFLQFLEQKTGVPVFFFLAIVWLTKHYLNLQQSRNVEVKVLKAPKSRLDVAISEFVDARKDTNDKIEIIVAFAEGGGIRAACHTQAVLRELYKSDRVRRGLFAINGVSGGAVGTAIWANNRDVSDDIATRLILKDYLSPIIGRGLFVDFPLEFLPVKIRDQDRSFDRASTLTDGLKEGSSGDTPEKFPVIYSQGTSVTDGIPYLMGPYQLLECGNSLPKVRQLPINIELDLATQATAAARFPVVTPAARISNSGRSDLVVDGGYYENAGSIGASRIVDNINCWAKRNGLESRIQVVVIRIGGESAVTTEKPNGGETPAAEVVIAPIRTVVMTLLEGNSAHVMRLRNAVDQYHEFGYIRPEKFKLPLGWKLSRQGYLEALKAISIESLKQFGNKDSGAASQDSDDTYLRQKNEEAFKSLGVRAAVDKEK